jgi:hypothetical protein
MIRHEGPFADPTEPHVTHPSTQSAMDGTGDSNNVVDLMKQLAMQGSHLAEQQLALIKAEMRESTADLKASVGSMVGAVVVGLAGLGVTLMGIAYLVGQAIDNTPIATLIVGLGALGISFILYRAGAKKMSAAELAPGRTKRTLQRTPQAVRGNHTTEHAR